MGLILALATLVPPATAQQPVNYTPPPPAPAAAAGTLQLDGLPDGVRDAVLAGIDAMQAWSSAAADDHFAYALSLDSTFGLARVLRIHMRNFFPSVQEHVRGTVDAAGRPIGEQIVVLAYRAYAPQSVHLFAAAKETFPNDHRIALEHASGLPGTSRLEALRALSVRYPDFAAPRMSLAFYLTQNPYLVESEAAEEALAVAEEAVRVAPGLAGAHVALAHVLQRMGRYDDAVPHLHTALRLDPKNAVAYELRAEITMRDGKTLRPVEVARATLDSARMYTLNGGSRLRIARTRSLLLMHDREVDAMIGEDTTLLRQIPPASWVDFAVAQWGRLAVQVAAAGRAELADTYLGEARRISTRPAANMLATEVLAYAVGKRPAEARRALEAYTTALGSTPTQAQAGLLSDYEALVLHAEGSHADALSACVRPQAGLWCSYVGVEANLALGRRTEAEALRREFLARKSLENQSIVAAILRYRAPRRG